MKQLIRRSIAVTIGAALVAPVLMAGPAAVNGSLGGFSANAQGGQSPGDWGIPQGGQSGPGQGSNQSGGGQNGAGQNSSQSGSGQNAAGQGKGPDAGGYGDQGNGQNSQNGNGQNGPGQQNSQSGNGQGQNSNDGPTKNHSNNPDGDGSGQGQHANDGPTKNNSNNPDGDGSGQGEHYDDGPTKNNSNNPDGNGASGSAEGEGPTKNNSNNPDGGRGGNSGNGSGSSSGSGSNDGGDFPPLDPPTDGQYDPANNGGEQQIPSGCAEAGSQCAQCVQRNEAVVQFNRRYLHVAWSTTHQTLEYTKQAIAFGDSVSGIHSTQALAWQLAGKPQITEAVASLRKTYDNKYRIYINNMEQALGAMNQCEQDNFAVRDLYQRFSSLYLEFVKARYASPD